MAPLALLFTGLPPRHDNARGGATDAGGKAQPFPSTLRLALAVAARKNPMTWLPPPGLALPMAWLALLFLPVTMTLSVWRDSDVTAGFLCVASCWFIIALRTLFSGRLFYLASYPIAMAGFLYLAADFSRNVDLLDLFAQWRTFSRSDVQSAMAPYLWPILAAAGLLAVLGAIAAAVDTKRMAIRIRHRVLVAGLGTAILVAWLPFAVWPRAWPLNALLITLAMASGVPQWAAYSTNASAASPRQALASWSASRALAPQGAETYVLLIGETLRTDFLAECGGPARLRRFAEGAIVACDGSAGADATHTSVPLLVSREMPGHVARVSDDATFQRAFAEVGFATYWCGVQDTAIAWPDARYQRISTGEDRDVLLPCLDSALTRTPQKRSIVLHSYGAHGPYCARFDPRQSPYPNICPRLATKPSDDDIADWRAMYANAVDDSVGFVNQIIARLSNSPGQVFLAFTPDHGENLLDDRRKLFGHAFKHPTRWDIQVPIVFWANDAWKSAHSAQWKALQVNGEMPLMHADVVPTLLAAAGIAYSDPRKDIVDLLAGPVPVRQRVVQTAAGATTTWQALDAESRPGASRDPVPAKAHAADGPARNLSSLAVARP